ncbi:MAG: J domain-containing protein [Dehalococcoidales bacterium]|nr:J domain-containing protein [Dehalococcoidales bacterium]
MAEDLNQIQDKLLGIMAEISEYIGKWINEIMQDTLNPAAMLEIIRNMGINPSNLSGMMNRQPEYDPYRILTLESSASEEEVKKRYREILHKLHPDIAGFDGASFLLREVMKAYQKINKERGWR